MMKEPYSFRVAGGIAVIAFATVFSAQAQMSNVAFGGYEPEPAICITPQERAEAEAKIAANITALQAAGRMPSAQAQRRASPPKLGWPIQASASNTDYGFHGLSAFPDQNTNAASMFDFNCGARTYDGHRGTDFFLWPFYWWKMDHDEVQVIAAAPGTITYKTDGNYDRNCSANSATGNMLVITHADGSSIWYGHMKNGSLTAKGVGETVVEGEYLGVVGSSGSSTGPHLHFEPHDASNRSIDPWQGACNALATNSWWRSQRPYYDSAINKISTHSAAVVQPACPGAETPNLCDVFNPGATIYFYTFHRDHQAGDATHHVIARPDGSVYTAWDSTNTVFYASSWWYRTFTPSAASPRGSWIYRATYKGSNYEHRFFMGSSDAALAIASAQPFAALGSPVTFAITITNTAAAAAAYLVVSNLLPSGAAFVSASAGGAHSGGVVRWTFTNLAANAITQLFTTILFTNTAPVGAITNFASVSTGTFDTDSANDFASAVVQTDHDGDGIPTSLEQGLDDANHNGVAAFLDAAETFDLLMPSAAGEHAWAAFSGAVYQLQVATNLLAPAAWINLGGPVTAQSATLSVADTNAAAQRAYRVRLQKLP